MTLSSKIEAATGPSRELDARIAQALGWKLVPQDYPERANWIDDAGRLVGRQDDPYCPPRYTASLDAARTLVPDGLRTRLAIQEDGRGACRLFWPDDEAVLDATDLRATPALAICAAALKARGL